MWLFLFWMFSLIQVTILSDNLLVSVAVIVSGDNRRPFSKQKITPALKLAEEKIQEENILSNVNISIKYGDSKCTSKDAPIEAFNFYMKSQVNVFLGPVCDYSLAPVARYAPFWDLPVISPGGFAHDFGYNKRKSGAEFPTLIRVGATFDSLASNVLETIKHYKWHKVKIIYDGDGHSYIVPKFCYLAASAMVHASKTSKMDYDFHMFIPSMHSAESFLLDEVGNDNSGKIKRKRKIAQDDKGKRVKTTYDEEGCQLNRSADTVLLSDHDDNSQVVIPSSSKPSSAAMISSQEDGNSSSGDSDSSSDTTDVDDITSAKMTTLKDTISRSMKVGIHGQTVYVTKLNCNDEMKKLQLPIEAARKLVKREGKLRREYHALYKKYNAQHHVFKSYEMTLSKKPQIIKAGFRKLSNRWYMDLRQYEDQDYVKDNGVCIALDDAWKLITHLNKRVVNSRE